MQRERQTQHHTSSLGLKTHSLARTSSSSTFTSTSGSSLLTSAMAGPDRSGQEVGSRISRSLCIRRNVFVNGLRGKQEGLGFLPPCLADTMLHSWRRLGGGVALSISHQGREMGARLLCISGEKKLASATNWVCRGIADSRGCLATRIRNNKSLIRMSHHSKTSLILSMSSRRFFWGGSSPQQPTTAAKGDEHPGQQEAENLSDGASPAVEHLEMQLTSTQQLPLDTSTLDGIQVVVVQTPSISTWDRFYHGSPDFWINVGFAQDVSYQPTERHREITSPWFICIACIPNLIFPTRSFFLLFTRQAAFRGGPQSSPSRSPRA
jgi:hypothetical protein